MIIFGSAFLADDEIPRNLLRKMLLIQCYRFSLQRFHWSPLDSRKKSLNFKDWVILSFSLFSGLLLFCYMKNSLDERSFYGFAACLIYCLFYNVYCFLCALKSSLLHSEMPQKRVIHNHKDFILANAWLVFLHFSFRIFWKFWKRG